MADTAPPQGDVGVDLQAVLGESLASRGRLLDDDNRKTSGSGPSLQDWGGAPSWNDRPEVPSNPGLVVRNTFIDVCPLEEESDGSVSPTGSPHRRNVSAPPSPTRNRNPWADKEGEGSEDELADGDDNIPHYKADGSLVGAAAGGAGFVGLRSEENELWGAKPPGGLDWKLKAPPGSPQKVRTKSSTQAAPRPALGDFFKAPAEKSETPTSLGGLDFLGGGALGSGLGGLGQASQSPNLLPGSLGLNLGTSPAGGGLLGQDSTWSALGGQAPSQAPSDLQSAAALQQQALQQQQQALAIREQQIQERLASVAAAQAAQQQAHLHVLQQEAQLHALQQGHDLYGAGERDENVLSYIGLDADGTRAGAAATDASRRFPLGGASGAAVGAGLPGVDALGRGRGLGFEGAAGAGGLYSASALAQLEGAHAAAAAQAAQAQQAAIQAAQLAQAAQAAQAAQLQAAQAAQVAQAAQAAAASAFNNSQRMMSPESMLALQLGGTAGLVPGGAPPGAPGGPGADPYGDLHGRPPPAGYPDVQGLQQDPYASHHGGYGGDPYGYGKGAHGGPPPPPSRAPGDLRRQGQGPPGRHTNDMSAQAAQGPASIGGQQGNAPWVMPGAMPSHQALQGAMGAQSAGGRTKGKDGGAGRGSEVKAAGEQKGRVPLSGGGPKRTDYIKKYGGAEGAPAEGVPAEGAPTKEKLPITTMMLKNIPCRKSQEEVAMHIDQKGFAGRYDFFYLPRDVKFRANLGYAFINFLTPEDASRFEAEMNGYRFNGSGSTKACAIVPAHVQGLVNNLAAFKRTEVMRSSRKPYFAGEQKADA